MEQSPYQEFLAHSTGEIFEPEAPEDCEHLNLNWKAELGEFQCADCEQVIDCPELLEALAPDLARAFDLQVCL